MDIYEQIVLLRREGRRGAVATIVNVRGSIPSFKTAKMLVRDDGSIVGTIGGGCVEADVWQAAREVMESEKPRTLKFDLNQDPKYDTGLVCGGTLEIFIEPVLPPALLYVFGAGHVAFNLCQVATTAGFDVVVADDRTSYATRERFPAAREVHALEFDEAMKLLDPNESSYVVIVTRGHRDDMRILRWAVQTRARYVGMIGSRRKVIEIFRTLQQEGLPASLVDRVHGGNCRCHHRGVDRRPAPIDRRPAPHELVSDAPERRHFSGGLRGIYRGRRPRTLIPGVPFLLRFRAISAMVASWSALRVSRE